MHKQGQSMTKPLEGIKIVEAAMWAFVPLAGAILADMGATVIKVEPVTGDPIRGLVTGAARSDNFDFGWECYNRGKQSITLDLRTEAGRAVLDRLLADADVFLTSILPPARAKLGIDEATIRKDFPNCIYATGSPAGQNGPEAHQGGYDAISFWARSGLASSMTEDGAEQPLGPPGPAFGDALTGSMLAGAVAAAVAKRALTGEASSVDVSLLAAGMWAGQRYISHGTAENILRFPRPKGGKPNNVLVANYRTKDDRFISLCMLQADKYWARLCEVGGRADLAAHPLYANAALRRENLDACYGELKAMFAAKPLAEWRELLGQQDGQWEAVQHVGEMKDDAQVKANDFIQYVDAGGKMLPIVSTPMQFDGSALSTARAPELGAHSDAILAGLGYDEDAIIDLKVQGVVF
jgi:crotonobetainyl-CoA:carnitine CoA-transferase CaiB-like acyl-CoA transferase